MRLNHSRDMPVTVVARSRLLRLLSILSPARQFCQGILLGLYRVCDGDENDILNWVPDFSGRGSSQRSGGLERDRRSRTGRRAGKKETTPAFTRFRTRTHAGLGLTIFDRPMAMGTRCHQLAMYVVFESPLQMLADSPSNYLREPEAMEFLSAVPSVWDETRVLDAKIAEYLVVARRKGRDWYIGAMTNWTPRDLDIDLAFLGKGSLRMETYQDGVNANRMASDYKLVKSAVKADARMKIHLAEGGGWAARIHP
jgi:hypothetical protein